MDISNTTGIIFKIILPMKRNKKGSYANEVAGEN